VERSGDTVAHPHERSAERQIQATRAHKHVDTEPDEHRRREFMHAMRADLRALDHKAAPMHDARSNNMNASAFSCGVSCRSPVQLVG
jgi:hypothetical protein